MQDAFDLIRKRLGDVRADYEILEHEPVFTMDDVKQKLSVPYSGSVKTIVVALRPSKTLQPVICGVRSDRRLDLKKVAVVLGVPRSRLTIMPQAVVEELLHMPRGGIGLIAPSSPLPVLLSTAFKSQQLLYFGIGRNDRTIMIRSDTLQQVVDITYAEIEE